MSRFDCEVLVVGGGPGASTVVAGVVERVRPLQSVYCTAGFAELRRSTSTRQLRRMNIGLVTDGSVA